jgi:hypothetical protein
MIARFILLVVILSSLVWTLKYLFDSAERQLTAKFVWQAIVSVLIALGIILPLFFLNQLSGL